LRSPKSFLAISSSREVSGKASSSPDEISSTEKPLEGSSCSYVRDDTLQDETSNGEADGGEDLVGEGGGVKVSLDEDKDLFTCSRKCLVPLLSSIVVKRGEKEKTQSEKVK
jgi:hypothetical protein